jgi:asparagine synthase (glutamine-hydrolysing)
MSGFTGIVNFDGAEADAALLGGMTDLLAFRGPDARQVWTEGPAGFGFTLLRTTEESTDEHQPFTFDHKVWIVADARIDARRDLVTQLAAKGRDASLSRPDVELILHAYHAWGEACVDHLWGDFAFVIWDAPRRQLLGARDHLGIKPFYYAMTASTVVASNTLDCIRLHPGVSSRHNESSIADFLLFEYNRDKSETFFQEIHRIPPGHTVVWTPQGRRVKQYWSLPADEPLRYPKLDDYTEHFRELLREAVSDRMRLPRTGVFMSGGLDSPALAATARDVRGDGSLCAFTYVFDGFDQERYYAGLVAKHLGIEIVFRDCLTEGVDPDWQSGNIHTSEPPANPMLLDRNWAFFQKVAGSHRVILCGEGPDAALHYEWRAYLKYLARNNRWAPLIRESLLHMLLHRRVPLLSTIPRAVRERVQEGDWTSGYPIWLNPEFEARLKLRERWADEEVPPSSHAVRPVGYNSLVRARWQSYFEEFDPCGTGAPLEFRHPYFDIRVLRFMLAVPALPWCRRKYLLRRAMRGLLPDPILHRDKAPMYPDPWTALAEKTPFTPINGPQALSNYVDGARVLSGSPSTLANFRSAMRPRSLNYWLKNADRFLYTAEEGSMPLHADEPVKPEVDERQSYSRPQLQVYGDLRAVTQAHGIPTKPDSSSRTAGTRP